MLILPFVEEDERYKQFRLDEPWDSPHNIELLAEIPRLYAPPPGKRWKIPANHTVCHVFVGRGAAFEGTEGLTWHDFSDGTSNTILIIEGGTPVPWTKPEELAYDRDEPLPPFDSFFKDAIRVGMADGSVRVVRKNLSEATWRAVITRNGGEPLPADW